MLPSTSDDALPVALAAALEQRALSPSSLGSVLRAEGIEISRARLHQLASGSGAPPTSEQLERLASVLGVSPGYFAEYRLWRARAVLDPAALGFERAMANFDRLRGRRELPLGREDGPISSPRYPGAGHERAGGARMSETDDTAQAVQEETAPAAAEDSGAAAAEDAGAADGQDAAAAALAEAELAEEAVPVPVGPAAGRQAKILLCDRGHRTVALWSDPTSCHARPTRSGDECGRQLYRIGELPEQVQKALNPLKASKKASKK